LLYQLKLLLYSTGANYVETILPEDTEVTVNNYPFTLFNDIVIRLYDDGGTFVEQQTNSNVIANNALGVLNSGIISDADGQPWIVLETTLKQVKKHTITETINKAEGYNKAVKITDKYYYSKISYRNSYTNNNYLELPKSHNEEYINPNIPTAYINVMDTTIGIRIPDVYMVDGNVSGNVMMEVYETKGKIFLPLTKYNTKDFKVALGNKGTSVSAATIYNIVVLADSRVDIADGKDTLTTAELKSRIVNNSTGMINTPITDLNLKTKGTYSGYDIFKTVDTITNRLYIAAKNTPEIISDLIHSRPDIYFNTVNLTISEITNFNYINKNANNVIIKSGTVFKDVNNVISIIDYVEENKIAAMSNIEKLLYFKDTNYYYTPYYYIIDTSLSYIESRVYDLDSPSIKNIKILGKNNNIPARVNTDSISVVKSSTGYKLYISLISDAEFKKLDMSLVRGQLTIPLLGGDTYVNFTSTYDSVNNLIVFDITTDLFISKNGYMDITNGSSTIVDKKVSLLSNSDIYIYTLEASVLE